MVQSYKNESKSQLSPKLPQNTVCCDVWYKVTKMRANHNYFLMIYPKWTAVMYGTKLQKWEQITTDSEFRRIQKMLWCMVQSYKNESKSQPEEDFRRFFKSCDVWYKVTKMRANHNEDSEDSDSDSLWCMVQSYKNESKSQQDSDSEEDSEGCDVWYKVTKMRANHNCIPSTDYSFSAVMYGTKLQKWEQITTIDKKRI